MDYSSLEECIVARCAEVTDAEPMGNETVFLELPSMERLAVAVALNNSDWLRRHCGLASFKAAEQKMPPDWWGAALAIRMRFSQNHR